MDKKLQHQVMQLENYYNENQGNRLKKFSKSSKVQNKILSKIQKIVQFCLIPKYSLKSSRYLLSEQSLMVISDPQIDHDKILGQIPGSYFSYSHKVGKVSYDFNHKYLIIQLEMIQTERVPLDYVMDLYKNFQVQNLPQAIKMIERVKLCSFYKQTNDIPSLFSKTWINDLMDDEELPAFIQKFTCSRKDKPISEYVYNQNYMKLVGVLPNVLMDVVLQSQQIPEISMDGDIEIWSNIIEGLTDSHDKPILKEHKALVMTYEGTKVGVIIKELFIHTYSEEHDSDYYVRKVTYQVSNPRAHQMVFDQERIKNNSVNYMMENKTNETNQRLNNQLMFETNTEVQGKYKKKEPCGYKLKQSDLQ